MNWTSDWDKKRDVVASMLGTTMHQNRIHTVERSNIDESGYEICWGEWPIFSQVRRGDVRLLKALVALRVQTLQQKNKLAAQFVELP